MTATTKKSENPAAVVVAVVVVVVVVAVVIGVVVVVVAVAVAVDGRRLFKLFCPPAKHQKASIT